MTTLSCLKGISRKSKLLIAASILATFIFINVFYTFSLKTTTPATDPDTDSLILWSELRRIGSETKIINSSPTRDEINTMRTVFGKATSKIRTTRKWTTTSRIPTTQTAKRISTKSPDNVTVEFMRNFAKQLNIQQKVHNLDQFGPLQPGDPVLLVQIHSRWHHLVYLLDSFRKAKDISRSLLVLSYDFYSPQIMEIRKLLNFSKAIEMFYPHAMQLYPNEYPGDEPHCFKAETTTNCSKDQFGNKREAKYLQNKQHFWWKLNRAMEHLSITRNHDGPFVIFEEDYFVTPDFLHVLKLMIDLKNGFCKDVCMLAVGNEDKFNYEKEGHLVKVMPMTAQGLNRGPVVDRQLWSVLKNHSWEYCHHDDYNPDITLHYMACHYLPSTYKALMAKAARIIHLGVCGFHYKGDDCSGQKIHKKTLRRFSESKDYFFPKVLKLDTRSGHYYCPGVYGGYADPRDHALCMSYSQDSPY